MPVCMSDKVDPALIVIKADLLRDHGILIIPGHFYLCHKRRLLHGNVFQIVYLITLFLVININIPGIEVHRAVFVNHQTVSGLACL